MWKLDESIQLKSNCSRNLANANGDNCDNRSVLVIAVVEVGPEISTLRLRNNTVR